MENIEAHDAIPMCDNKAVLEITEILFSQLNSLIPHNWSSKLEVAMLPDQLAVAANYIKAMRQKIDNMKEKIRQQQVMRMSQIEEWKKSEKKISLRVSWINIHSMGSTLMVVAVTGLEGQKLFYQLVSAVEEEGAQVVNANLVTTNDKLIHTIHSQAPDRIGDKYDPSILTERLKRLVDSL